MLQYLFVEICLSTVSPANVNRCFILMMAISTLHNMSRSIGCALLALVDTTTLASDLTGEFLIFFFYWCWKYSVKGAPKPPGGCFRQMLHGALILVVGSLHASVAKTVADFTGCVHFRHPWLAGGACHSALALWTQIYPFLALALLRRETEGQMTDSTQKIIEIFLLSSTFAWVLLNVEFFRTIDPRYFKTFYSTQTPKQFVVDSFLRSENDFQKFELAFGNPIFFSAPIHLEIKQWVNENIQQWQEEAPAWFKVDLIPDEFLPLDLFEAEGGANRRRSSVNFSVREISSVSLREIVGLREGSLGRVHPQVVEEMRVEDT